MAVVKRGVLLDSLFALQEDIVLASQGSRSQDREECKKGEAGHFVINGVSQY